MPFRLPETMFEAVKTCGKVRIRTQVYAVPQIRSPKSRRPPLLSTASRSEASQTRRPVGALTLPRAVPPPASEFLVQGTPGIVAVGGDAVVVGRVVVRKWKDTGSVNEFWKRANMPSGGKLTKGIGVLLLFYFNPHSRTFFHCFKRWG